MLNPLLDRNPTLKVGNRYRYADSVPGLVLSTAHSGP